MTQAQDDIGAPALTAVAGYLAQRSNLCAKVIDRDGQVMAINRRGLELLETESADVCGQVWTEFWEGEDRAAAAAAVDIGFGGKPCEFVGTFRTAGTRSAWEVEILPLEWQDGAVKTLLVLSTRIGPALAGGPLDTPHPDVAALRSMSESLRALAETAALASRAAAQLRAVPATPDLAALAGQLEGAGRRAGQAVEDLGALLRVNPRSPS
ncbi:MAG: PAS domain-containing protein [Rhodobacteraceae bacterium]|nr:PAS domain-containing protein [Paracoccaceae bacterium]